MQGFVLIDKPQGITSFDVVAKVRKLTGEKRVGHSGTLDPLATGLLIVAVGRGATKHLQKFVGLDKEYEVTGRFGYVSDTYDADCDNIVALKPDFETDRNEVEKIIKADFLGEIKQVPPAYSAIKIAGKKAYELARKGKIVSLGARSVTIEEFKVLEFKWPLVSFRIYCSSGTYVRSLIHDLGQKLGCGAYVTKLRRTKIGDFKIENAYKLDDFSSGLNKNIKQVIIGVEEFLRIC